jgi:hypothetical protein
MDRLALVRRQLALPALVIAVALLGVLRPSSTRVAAQAPDRVNVLITFARTPGAAEQGLVRAFGGLVRHSYHLVPGIAATLPGQAVAALRNTPGVLAVEADLRIEAYDAELDSTWGVNRIGAGTPHASGLTGAGVRVAVFDSGVEYTHYELAHAFAGGWDFVNDDDDPLDDNGHGTHVSGTIAAADDDEWVVGAAPGVQLYGVKILDATGAGDFSDVIAGLQWAVDQGIQIANHSYGSAADPGTLVAQAFANSAAAGVLHVAAAGNSGNCRGTGNSIGYPARYDQVIAVGATDQADARTCTSSTGPDLELAAPGDWIPSSYLNGDIAAGSGTSMASPHVAGAAALVMGAGVLDAAQARSLLIATAQDLGQGGHDRQYGFGLVNAAGAVSAAGVPPPSVFVGLSTDETRYDPAAATAFLTISVRNDVGTPIAGLTPDHFSSQFDGVPAEVAFVETAAAGLYTGELDLAGLAEGQHGLTVQVTSAGVTGGDTSAFVIAAPPVPGTIRIPSITYAMGHGRDKRTLLITIAAVDGTDAPVANAAITVVVYLNGQATWLGQSVTDASGHLTFGLPNAPSGEYYTEVWDVSAGALVWDTVTPENGFVR